jgi:hypothetical protein
MDKLNQLFASTPSGFAAAFVAVGDGRRAPVGDTTATFWLEGGITRAGAGFAWGNGELSYQGRGHAFRLSGLSIADVPAANICANGSVIHLRRLSDFTGRYLAGAAGDARADDDTTTLLRNEHGVMMKLTATDAAWRVNLLINGLRVRLKLPR